MQTQVRRLGGVYGDCKEDKNLELLTGYKYTIRVSFLIHLLAVFKYFSCSKVRCFFRESSALKVTGCNVIRKVCGLASPTSVYAFLVVQALQRGVPTNSDTRQMPVSENYGGL